MPRTKLTEEEKAEKKEILNKIKKEQGTLLLGDRVNRKTGEVRNNAINKDAFLPAKYFANTGIKAGKNYDLINELPSDNILKLMDDFAIAKVKKYLVMEGYKPTLTNVKHVVNTEILADHIENNFVLPKEYIMAGIEQASDNLAKGNKYNAAVKKIEKGKIQERKKLLIPSKEALDKVKARRDALLKAQAEKEAKKKAAQEKKAAEQLAKLNQQVKEKEKEVKKAGAEKVKAQKVVKKVASKPAAKKKVTKKTSDRKSKA